MIDTLKLSVSKFSVRDNHSLTVNLVAPSQMGQTQTGQAQNRFLWIGGGGKPVMGVSAEYFSAGIRVYIQPYRESHVSTEAQSSLWITFSVPKAFHGGNLHPLSVEQFVMTIERLRCQLDEIGIECDVWTARVRRVDLFRNAETDRPFSDYAAIFRLAQARQKHKSWPGPGSFSMGNKQERLIAYDKTAERKHRGWDVAGWPNLMRVECGLLTDRKVQSALKVVTTHDLVERYEELPNYYEGMLRRHLFGADLSSKKRRPTNDEKRLLELNEKVSRADEIAKKLDSCKQNYGRNWRDSWLKDEGIKAVLDRYGDQPILEAIEKEGGAAIRRRMQLQLRPTIDSDIVSEGYTDGEEGNTLNARFRELQQKLLFSR